MSRSGPRKAPKKRRCAIYTRKSSEEGLEQDFNSLDAQREACEAFIKSQKHEGWQAIDTLYDDGGISGATMERPALQRLLADITAGDIHVVVVYKVDRLTRALSDFAKIVEIFDDNSVSFVSVTQQFNTTSSMGRLTLNVLLSFAQFEREVTGERIRDKIAASKKKGMWMGGFPPLGYDAKDKKLIVNQQEAETVRHIFRRYIALGSIHRLKEELNARGIVSKARIFKTGRRRGGVPLARGALYLMLQNRIYRGEIVHKEKSYPGLHSAIIDRELWDRVQAKLAMNRIDRKNGTMAKEPSLLSGLLFDDHGHPMTPSHATRNGKRYRYYVSQPLITKNKASTPTGRRIPSGDIEKLVMERVRSFLSDQSEVFEATESYVNEPAERHRLARQAMALSKEWPTAEHTLPSSIISRIEVHEEKVEITLSISRLVEVLRGAPVDLPQATECENSVVLSVPARLKRAGMGMRMIVEGKQEAKPDPGLIKLIIKAHEYQEKLVKGRVSSLSEIAEKEGVSGSYITRVIRLSFLAPDIIKAILLGNHPPTLTAASLNRASRLPLDWEEQRKTLGFV